MGYIETVLAPGEQVNYTSRLHWIIYGPGFGMLGLEVVALIAMFAWPQFMETASNFSIACLVLAVVLLAVAWIQQNTTEIAVTNRRIIFKAGLLRRRTIEMNLDKVESVDVNQSIFGRLLDYGTVIIRGTGSGVEPLSTVDEPLKLRSFVTNE